MKRLLLAALLILTFSSVIVSASADYISQPPPTVYESSTPGPQTLGFDSVNNLFIAHPGWLNDKLVHYYKFRMYTPDTYPTTDPPAGPVHIPVAPLYLITTSGDFSGIVQGQLPIIRWHTADGENYSDFVHVYWVNVASAYVANTYKSYGDIVGNVSSSNIIGSDIYANVPVVPTGSKLQDPVSLGTTAAPINPLMVWYRGVQVQTFVFETTSQQFANYFNPLTRTGSAATTGSGYEISVVPFVSQGSVRTVPIFHLNQYAQGVTEGVNNGGPWKSGGRNIIGFDRGDAGYTPLWQVFWVSKVPVDYSADMASSPAQLTDANGFQVNATPMYVNCPNVGPLGGGAANTKKASAFSNSVGSTGNFSLSGALVMVGNTQVTASVGGTVLATTTTNMMGGFVLNIPASQLPSGQSTINVKDNTGNSLFDATVAKASGTVFDLGSTIPVLAGIIVAAVVVAGLIVYRRSHRKVKQE